MLRNARRTVALSLAVIGLAAAGARADVIDDALALAKKTGRPILAIAGSDT